jgi:hypothetical protein
MKQQEVITINRSNSKDTVVSIDETRGRFNAAIVDIVNWFNLLDENLGLSISHLEKPGKSPEAYLKISKMGSKKKIAYLTKKLSEHPRLKKLVNEESYTSWLSLAETARFNRNRYLHGRWAYLWHLDRPVEFVSPVWMEAKLGNQANERMTLEELESRAKDLKACCEAFLYIRDKNRF